MTAFNGRFKQMERTKLLEAILGYVGGGLLISLLSLIFIESILVKGFIWVVCVVLIFKGAERIYYRKDILLLKAIKSSKREMKSAERFNKRIVKEKIEVKIMGKLMGLLVINNSGMPVYRDINGTEYAPTDYIQDKTTAEQFITRWVDENRDNLSVRAVMAAKRFIIQCDFSEEVANK